MPLPMISSTGLSVVYEPEKPIADIVFIHGLQGDPLRTWLWKGQPRIGAEIQKRPSTLQARVGEKAGFESSDMSKKRLFSRDCKTKRCVNALKAEAEESGSSSRNPRACTTSDTQTYWPQDLLPLDCPNARIITWGYDSKVTKWIAGPANQNNILTHARDFLCAYSVQRESGRPIVFVVHSLGGLVLKEILRQSDVAKNAELTHDIVRCTHSAIFFGTPHRGSPRNAGIGESLRKVASGVLRVDSNTSLLRTLSANSPEVEIGREEFQRIKREHKIRVKTFQEAFGVLGANFGGVNSKVVPDTSSSLDDPEEQKESLQANHMDMCRFSHAGDPEYAKVARVMKDIMKEIENRRVPDLLRCLQSLRFSGLGIRRQNTPNALTGTCDWALQSKQYMTWMNGSQIEHDHGILFIQGQPGSGKSVLMKEALARASESTNSNCAPISGPDHIIVADFFFDARGSKLDKTPLGMYRALAHQMILQDEVFARRVMDKFTRMWDGLESQGSKPDSFRWEEQELVALLLSAAQSGELQPSLIFIDGLDECESAQRRGALEFLKMFTDAAYTANWQLKLCLSSRHFPRIKLPFCQNIVMEHGNQVDIDEYVESTLKYAAPQPVLKMVKKEIRGKAQGIFLWVALVTHLVLEDLDNGMTVGDLLSALKAVPVDLANLFSDIFRRLSPHERHRSIILFQIVLLSADPLSASEICVALAFNRPHSSLRSFEQSTDAVSIRSDAERRIRGLSCGLIGFRNNHNNHSANGKVEFIHESVRQFFLEDGFAHLSGISGTDYITQGHCLMANICLNVLKVDELLPVYRTDDDKEAIMRYFGILHYSANNLLVHLDGSESAGFAPSWALNELLSCKSDIWNRRRYIESIGSRLVNARRPKTEIVGCETPLQAACLLQLPRMAQRLLDIGEDPNESSGSTKPALIAAVQPTGRSEDMVRQLLLHGAQVNAVDSSEQTALHHAAMLGLSSVVERLIVSGANLNARDGNSQAPLHLAVEKSHYGTVKHLLLNGAEPDVWWERVVPNGHYTELSPLHIAVLNDDLKMVQILVQANACLEIFDNSNRIPYDIANARNHVQIKDYLWRTMMEEGLSAEVEDHLEAMEQVDGVEPIQDPLCVIPGLDEESEGVV